MNTTLRVRKGAREFAVPPCERVDSVVLLRPGGARVTLEQIDMADLAGKRSGANQNFHGAPLYYALAKGAHEVHLFPLPAISMNVEIEYVRLRKSS